MSLSRRMKKAAFRANMKAAANKNSVNNTHINEEPELGQEDSFLANMLGMISHSPFMKKVLLNAVGLTLMATSAGYGAVTAAEGSYTNVITAGDVYKITTSAEQRRGTTALNAFNQFSVEAGKIANIYYENGVSNIVNFVGPRINIQGVVNTIKNTGTYLAPDGNQVGGRLFFLSSNGMVLGTAGVVNTGSFYAIVPNATFMQQFLTGDLSNPTGATTGVKTFYNNPGQTFIDQINNITGGLVINGYNDNGANNGITLNSAGSIQIQGKINANNIGLYARNTTNYGISITGVDEYDKAELKTYKQTNFASIVNTTNNASTYVVDTATFAENDGEIRIVALGKGDSVVTGINSSNAEIKTAANGSVTILSEGKANLGAIAGNGVTIEANKGIELDGIQAYNDSSIKVKNTGASTLGNINLNKNGGAAGDIIVKGDIKGSKNAVIEIINDAAASDGNGSIQLGKAIGNNEFKNSTLYGKSVTLTAKNNIIDAYSSDTKNQITANDQINITATNGNISITNMEYKTNDTNKANLTVTATGGSATLKNLVGRKVSVTAKKGIDINGVVSNVLSDDTGNAINIVNEGAGATGDITLKGIIKADGNANGTFDINIENKATASSENNGNIYLGEVTLSEDDLVYASLSGKNITIKATNAIVDRDHGQTDTKNKIKSTEVGSGVWNGISLTATNGDLSITNTQFLKADGDDKTYAKLALATGGKATLNDLVGKTVSVTAKKGIEVNNVQSTRLADGNVNEISLKNTGSGATGNILLKGTITADGYDNTNVIAGAGDILIQNEATANGDNGNIQIGEEGVDDLVKAELIGKNVTLTASNAIADTQNATTPTTKNLIKSNSTVSLTATKSTATITNTEFDTTDTVELTKNYADLTVNTGDKATVKNLVGRNVTVNAKAGIDIDGVTAKGYKQIESETVTDVVDGTIAITNIEDSTGNIVLKGDIIANGKNGNNDIVATVLSEGNGVITVENKAVVTGNGENGNIQIGEVVGSNLNAARIVGEQITLKASDGIADTKHASKTTKNYIKSSDNEVSDGHGITLTTTEGDISLTNTVFGKKVDNEVLSSAQLVVDAKGGKTTLKDLVGINVDVKAKAGIDIDGVTATGRVYETNAQKGAINIVNIANSTGDIVLKGTITAKGVVSNALEDGKGDITVENKATASEGNGNVIIGEDGASDLNPAIISGKTISIKASNNIVDAKHSSGSTKNIIQSAQIGDSAGTVLFEATSGDIRIQNIQFGANEEPVYAELTVDAKGGKAILDNLVGRTVTITAKKGVEVNGIRSTALVDNTQVEVKYEIKVLNTNSATGDIIVKGAISANGNEAGAGDILIQNDAAASDGNGNIQIGKVEDTELVEAKITAKNITMVAKNGVLDKATESSTNKNLIQSAGKVNITANTSDVQIQNTQFGADVNPVYAEITVAAVNGKTILDNLVGKTVEITAKKGVEVNGIKSTTLVANTQEEVKYEIKVLNTNSATGDIVLKGAISANNGIEAGKGDILIQNDSTVSNEGNIQIGKVEDNELLNAEITGKNVYMAAQNGILDAYSEASTNKNAINTDGTVVMEAKTGTITLGNTKVNAEKVNVEGDLAIIADKKAIEIANLEVNSNLAVIAPVESVTVNNVVAKGDLFVNSHTTASLTDVTANTADVVANKGIVLDGVKTTGIIVPAPEGNDVELRVRNTGEYAAGDIIIKGTVSANDGEGVGKGDILIQNDAEINKEELGQHGNIYIGTKEGQVTTTATINGENVKLQAKDKITDAGDFDSNKLNAINSKGTVEMIAGTLVEAATYKNGEIELDNTKFGTTDTQDEPTEFGDFALTAGEKVTLNNLTDLTEDVYVEKLNGVVGTTNSKQAIVKSLTLNTTSKEATVNNVKTTGDLIVNSGKDALLDTVTAKSATITSAKGVKLHDVTTTGVNENVYGFQVKNTESGNIELTGNISANDGPGYGDILIQNTAEGTTETNGNILIGVEGESMATVAITGDDITLAANNTIIDAGDKDSENKNTIKSKGTVEFVAGKVVVGPEPSIEGGNITIDNTEVDTTDAGENPEYGEFVLKAGEGVTLTDVTQKVDELAVIAKTATIDKVNVKGGEGHVSVNAGETATITTVEADGDVLVESDKDATLDKVSAKTARVVTAENAVVNNVTATGLIQHAYYLACGVGVFADKTAKVSNVEAPYIAVMTKEGAELENIHAVGGALEDEFTPGSYINPMSAGEIYVKNSSNPAPEEQDEATGDIVLKGEIIADHVGVSENPAQPTKEEKAGTVVVENHGGNILLGKETEGDEPEFTPVTIEGKTVYLGAGALGNLTDAGKAAGIEKGNAIKSSEGTITLETVNGSVVLDNTLLNNPTSELIVNANKIEAIDDITAKFVNIDTANGAVFNNIKTVAVQDQYEQMPEYWVPKIEINIQNESTGNIVLKGVITADDESGLEPVTGKGDIYIRNNAPAGVEDAENGNIVLGAVTGEEPVFENVTINGKTVGIYAANNVIDENEVEEETVTKNVIKSDGEVAITTFDGDINLDNTDFDTTDTHELDPENELDAIAYGEFTLTAGNNVKLSNAVANVNTLVVTAYNNNAELADVKASGDLSVNAMTQKASLDNVTAKTAFVKANTGIELKDVTATGVNIPDATPIYVGPLMANSGNYAIAAVNGAAGGEGNIVLKGKIEAKNADYDPEVPGSKEYSNILVENLAQAHPVVEPAVTDYENGNIILHGEEVAGEGENPATYNPVTISGENIIMYAKNDVADVVMSGEVPVENSEYKNVIKSKAKYDYEAPALAAPTHVYVEARQDLILSNTDFDTTDTHELNPAVANDAIAHGDFELVANRDASLSNNVSKADNVSVKALTHDANLTDVDVTGDLTVLADHKADLDTINANTVAVRTFELEDDEAGVYINNLTSDGLRVLDINDTPAEENDDKTIGLGVITAGKAVLTNTTSKIATVMANNGVELSNVTTTGLISDLNEQQQQHAPVAEIFVSNQNNGNIVLKDSVAANKVTPATAETEETTVVGAGNIVLMNLNQAMPSEENGNIVLGEFVEGDPEIPTDDVVNPVTVDGNIIDMMASANITDAGKYVAQEAEQEQEQEAVSTVNAINAKTSVGMMAQQFDVTLDNTVTTVKNKTEEGTVYGELTVFTTKDVTLTKSTEAGVTVINAGNDVTISNLISKATLLTPNAENPNNEIGLEVSAGGKATLTDVTAKLAKIQSVKGTTATRLTTTAVSAVAGVDSINIRNAGGDGNIVLIDSVAANNVIPATAETEETTVVGAGNIAITNDVGDIVLGELIPGEEEEPPTVIPVTVDGNNITMTASANITDAGTYVAPEAEQEQEAESTVNAINAKGNVALTATNGNVEFDNTDLTAKNDTVAENVTYGNLDVTAGTSVIMTKSTEAGVTRITAENNDVTLSNLSSKATLPTPEVNPANEIGLVVTAEGGKATLTDVTAKLAKIQSGNGTTATRLTTTAVSVVEGLDSINITNNTNGDIKLIDSVAANKVTPATADTEETTVVGAGSITITNTNDGGDIVLGQLEGEVLTKVTVDGNNITMTASANITDEEKADSEDANAINAKGNVALTATNGKVEFDNTDLTAKNDTVAENVTYGNLDVTAKTYVTMTKSTEAGVTRITAENNDVTLSNLSSKATLPTPEVNPTNEIGLEVTAGGKATLTDVTAKLAKIQSGNGTTATRLTTTAVSVAEGIDSINIDNNGAGDIVLIDKVAANNVIPAETEETTVVGAGNITINNHSGNIVLGEFVEGNPLAEPPVDDVLNPVTVDGNNITMTASANITDAGTYVAPEAEQEQEQEAVSTVNAINAKGNVALTATNGKVEFDNTDLTAKDDTNAENVTYGNLNVTAGKDVTMTKSTEAGVTRITADDNVTLNNLTSKATVVEDDPANEIGLVVTAEGGKATLTDVTAKLAKIESSTGATVTRLTTTAVSEVEDVASINITNNDEGDITLIGNVTANNEAYDPDAENPVPQYGNITINNAANPVSEEDEENGSISLGELIPGEEEEPPTVIPVTVDGNNITMTASANITDAGTYVAPEAEQEQEQEQEAESTVNAINAKGNVALTATNGKVEFDNTDLTAKNDTDAENITYGDLDVTAGTSVIMTKSTEAGVTRITANGDEDEDGITISNLISKATVIEDNPDDEIGLKVTAGNTATLTDVTAKLAKIQSVNGTTATRLTTTAVSAVEGVDSINIANNTSGNIVLIDSVAANNEVYDPNAEVDPENPVPQYGNITIQNNVGNIVLGEVVVEANPNVDPAIEEELAPVTVDGNNITMTASANITDAGTYVAPEAEQEQEQEQEAVSTVNAINASGDVLAMADAAVTLDNTTTVAVGNVVVAAENVEIDDVTADTVVVLADGDATVSNVTSEGSRLAEEAFDYNGDEIDDDITIGMAVVAGGKATVSDTTSKFAAIMAAGGAELNNVETTGVKGEEDALPEYNEKTYEFAVLNRGEEAVNDVLVKGEIKANEGNLLIANESGTAVFNAAAISGANVAITASTNVEDTNVDEASNSIVAGESLEIAAAEDVVLNNTVINSPNAVLTMTANTITDAKSITASKAAITAHNGIALADVTTSAADENDPEVTFELDIQNVAAGEEDPATGNIVVTGKLIAGAGDIKVFNSAEADGEEDGNVTLEDDVEGNNVGIGAEGDVEVNDVTAGTDVTMVAEGDLTANGNVSAGADVDMSSTGDLIAKDVEAEGKVDVEADNITAGNVSAGTDVAMTTEGNLTANDVSSEEGNVSLAAGDPEDEESSSAMNIGNVTAGENVAMNSTGDLTAKDVAAEGNVSAEADNITAGNVSAGTDVAMTTEGNLTAKDITATTGTAELNAANATVEDVSATSVEIATTGDLSAKDIAATAGNVEVSATNVEVNNVTAGTDATIAAQGEVNVKGEVNAENVNIESNLAGDVNIDSAIANNNLDVTVNDGDLTAGTLQGDNIKTTLNSEEGVADVDTYAVGSSLDSNAANTLIGKIEQLDPNSPIDVKFSGVNGSDEYNAEVKNIIYNPGADMEGEVAYTDKEENVQKLGPDGIVDIYNKVPKFDNAAREIYMLRPGMEMGENASKVDYKDTNKFVLLFTRIKEYIRNSVVAITSGLLAKQEDNSNKQQSQEHKKLNLMDAYGAHEKFVENEGVELIERDFGDSSEGEEVAKHSISVNSKGEPIIR